MVGEGLALLEVDGGVARLTLNRPEKRNALSLELLEALHARVEEVSGTEGVKVCVVEGAGRSFCAGMDLKAVLDEPGAPRRLLESIAELTIRLRTLDAVTVAKVRGAAIGGGCGLVAVCDLSVTHDDARLGYPEVDLGVCPAVVAPWLVRKIGAGRARSVLLRGGTMTGADAADLGLVTESVGGEQLDSAVERLVERLSRAGGRALRETKRLLNELESPWLHEAVRRGAGVSAAVVEGEEARSMLRSKFGGG